MLFGFIYMPFWKRQKISGQRKKISGGQLWVERRDSWDGKMGCILTMGVFS